MYRLEYENNSSIQLYFFLEAIHQIFVLVCSADTRQLIIPQRKDYTFLLYVDFCQNKYLWLRLRAISVVARFINANQSMFSGTNPGPKYSHAPPDTHTDLRWCSNFLALISYYKIYLILYQNLAVKSKQKIDSLKKMVGKIHFRFLRIIFFHLKIFSSESSYKKDFNFFSLGRFALTRKN